MSSRAVSRAVLVALVAGALSSCGGGSSPSSPSTGPSTPPQAVRTVLGTTDFTLRPATATFKSIDNPPIGTMDATADWGNPANTINLYATDGRCPGFVELQAGRCTVLARAEGAAKPKKVTFSNTTANAVYLFWISNAGTSNESGGLEIGVTTQGPIVNPPSTGSPSPTPSGGGDPRAGLPPGPVTQARAAIRSIDQGGFDYRDPQQDSAGNWIVYPGEFVVFDLSQRNGAGDKCQWINDPVWSVDDQDGALDIKGSSQPFLLRVDVVHKGYFEVSAKIDGIESNILPIISMGHTE